MTPIKTEAEIAAMRESGRMLATVLEFLRGSVTAGITPKDLSSLAKKELQKLGGEPAFLGFSGYPDIICISVNEQVQHSIPSDRQLESGDVVNLDFGVRYKGMITDAGISVCVDNKTTPDIKRLLTGTERALQDGLKVVRAGCYIGDISATIERTLRKNGLGIVRELVGHGVGHKLHEDPEIPNYGRAGTGSILKSGMTVAIEPIATLGKPSIFVLSDGWTLVTADKSWSAQFEHTVLVTSTGCEVLTRL